MITSTNPYHLRDYHGIPVHTLQPACDTTSTLRSCDRAHLFSPAVSRRVVTILLSLSPVHEICDHRDPGCNHHYYSVSYYSSMYVFHASYRVFEGGNSLTGNNDLGGGILHFDTCHLPHLTRYSSTLVVNLSLLLGQLLLTSPPSSDSHSTKIGLKSNCYLNSIDCFRIMGHCSFQIYTCIGWVVIVDRKLCQAQSRDSEAPKNPSRVLPSFDH